MRTPDDHLARLGNVVGISQATLRAHVALYGQQLDTLAAMRLERQRLLQMAGPGAPADPEVRALMHKRIRDLELRIEGPLAECIAEVEGELAAHGITWRPLWSIGCAGLVDGEFWTADRANTISIPWYLANQQLWASVNEVKVRYTKEDVMRVLRHEVGHALGYAFELWRLVSWTKAFGDFEQPYKDEYVPDPASTGYVRYLHETGPSINAHYAQKHPDEDWAETFATWIDPGVDWKARYPEGTGARAKLDFVDRLLVEQGMAYGWPTCWGVTPPGSGSCVPAPPRAGGGPSPAGTWSRGRRGPSCSRTSRGSLPTLLRCWSWTWSNIPTGANTQGVRTSTWPPGCGTWTGDG